MMESSKEIEVVVIGGLHHNTLCVIRALGESGIPVNNINVILVDHEITDKNFIAKSKYNFQQKNKLLQ